MSRRLSVALGALALAGCGGSDGGGSGPGPDALRAVAPASPLARIKGRPVGPRTGHVAWRRTLEGAVVPGPVEGADGLVLAASNGGVLHALDPATGRDRWTFDGKGSYGIDLSTSATVARDGTVYWPGPDNTVFVLDGRTGTLRGRATVTGQPTTPVLRGDHLYVQDTLGSLTAFTLAEGTPRREWRRSLGTASYGSPAIGRDGTIYTTVDDDLVAVAADGSPRWRVHARNQVEVSPAVGPDGTITFGANDHHQYGVTPDGKVRWRYDLGDLTYSSAAVTPDGLAYVGDHRGLVSALDIRTGKLRYRVLGKGRTATQKSVGVWTRPAVDGRHAVYFGTRPGHLYGFDGAGHRLFDLDLGGTVDSYPLLTSRGVLVAGSEAGTLTAVR